jgi:hypothetical protein
MKATFLFALLIASVSAGRLLGSRPVHFSSKGCDTGSGSGSGSSGPSHTHTYALSDDKLSWHAAEASCVAQGGHLASCHDDATEALFQTLVSGQDAWIGLYDPSTDEAGFEWVDGSCVQYESWAPGEPNNLGEEDCVHIAWSWSLGGGWNDQSCSTSFRYICQFVDEIVEDTTDHCDPDPCNGHGTCTDTGADFFCTCSHGFTGVTCDTPVSTTPFSWTALMTAGTHAKESEVCASYEAFQSNIGTGSFSGITISSSLGGTTTCSNPSAATSICNYLGGTSGTSVSFDCDGQTWWVGDCGYGLEINVGSSGICRCDTNSGVTVRPCIHTTQNWGGHGPTCSPGDQELSVTCHGYDTVASPVAFARDFDQITFAPGEAAGEATMKAEVESTVSSSNIAIVAVAVPVAAAALLAVVVVRSRRTYEAVPAEEI